jgi:glycerol-3-phosphate dehydrogenase (NAD(P)+)
MQKIAVVGCGAFGYALALLLSKTHSNKEVFAYDVMSEVIETLQQTKKHPFFHTDIEICPNLLPTKDKEECLKNADLVILAVPAQYLRDALESLNNLIPQDAIILNVSKALEKNTNKRMSEVISEYFPNDVATISGGMLAHDVAKGLPVGADIGCASKSALATLKSLFEPTTVHIDTTTDIIGIELAGALKNVLAIGAGIIDGLNFGFSAKAFFVAQCLREVENLAVKLGARHETFHTASNAWMGDILTTCYGNSRNRLYGEMIGQGKTSEEAITILREQKKHAEGHATLKLVKELCDKYEVAAPLVTKLYDIVYQNKSPSEAFKDISSQ